MTSTFLMFACISCITLCSIRCEPVRWTSTLTSGYAASNSLATFSALGRASDVYQTTLPSFFAASSRGSWATASVGSSRTAARANSARRTSQVVIDPGSYAESRQQILQRAIVGQPVHARDHAVDLGGGQRQRGVTAELGLDLRPRQRRVGTAMRAILALAQRAAIGERDLHVTDELPRIVDRRVELVGNLARHFQHGRLVHRG